LAPLKQAKEKCIIAKDATKEQDPDFSPDIRYSVTVASTTVMHLGTRSTELEKLSRAM
jgi:hypothetical protein